MQGNTNERKYVSMKKSKKKPLIWKRELLDV